MELYEPYKTAETLGISEEERAGLIVIARELSRDDYAEAFDMTNSCKCISGKLDAYLERPNSWTSLGRPEELKKLYLGERPYWDESPILHRDLNTPQLASGALYKYLLR